MHRSIEYTLINLSGKLTRGYLVVNSGAARCLVRPLFDGACDRQALVVIAMSCLPITRSTSVLSRREFLMSYYIVSAVGGREKAPLSAFM